MVEVAPVIQKDVPVQGEWVGTLEGYVNAQISPQVSGYLIRQDYHEGAFVKKGEVLFEIDPRPFQAALDQAKGQLAQAEAQMANAELNVKRDIPEAEAHAIPQSQLDTDTQSLRRSEEHTSELQSRLHLVCRLLLEKKKIITTWARDPITLVMRSKIIYLKCP